MHRTVQRRLPVSGAGAGLPQAACDVVDAELDESFFRTRAQRSSLEELLYMRARAHLGTEAHKAADVTGVLGKASEQVASSVPA